MNKIVIFLALVCCFNICLSQNNQGIIIYKKEILEYLSEKDEFIKNNKILKSQYYLSVQEIDLNVKELLKDINYKLIFNSDVSVFEAGSYLELGNNKYYNSAVGPYGRGIYFTDIKKNEYYTQLDAYGELFLIKNSKADWELLNETKKIGNYLCYKATTIRITQGREGIIKSPVIAWYAPELAVPFGPIGFGGLPGLIIELEIKSFKFYVSKVNLNPKGNINVKLPSKGRVVTKNEFDEIGMGMMGNLRKLNRKQ